MRAIIKEPSKPCRIIEWTGKIDEAQKLVGGFVEEIKAGENLVILVDEEGILKNRQNNFELMMNDDSLEILVGNCLFCRETDDKDDWTGLSDKNVETIQNFLNKTVCY